MYRINQERGIYYSFRNDICFQILNVIISDTLEALLELLQIQVPSSAEPDKLVREAAQGHVDAVRDILGKCPDKVLLNIPLQFQDCQTDDLIGKLLITHLGRQIARLNTYQLHN